jgi:hypothetical protein
MRPTPEQVEMAQAVVDAPEGQLPPFLVLGALDILDREREHQRSRGSGWLFAALIVGLAFYGAVLLGLR